jgi:hypothetical protein
MKIVPIGQILKELKKPEPKPEVKAVDIGELADLVKSLVVRVRLVEQEIKSIKRGDCA